MKIKNQLTEFASSITRFHVIATLLSMVLIAALCLAFTSQSRHEKMLKLDKAYEVERLRDSLTTAYALKYIDTLAVLKQQLEAQHQHHRLHTLTLLKQNEKYSTKLDSLNALLGKRPRF